MQEELICPYPGLRPFNEDEAIFFKGRDEHIEQITRQLEEKKFLMLTGASGDGKSSLVYAGLIPNARAGFFKAKFNNWIVVDFRPERTPLKNLADALSDKFSTAEKDRFQNELQFGFSALIDIYTQSQYYVDKNSAEYLALDEAEKKKAARKGANLMILVDQFEEFFTNPENYSNGKTSVDSQLVVNLILETSRIALEKDISIYVICTMRSDYIGQCASFRGLPEAIGFSQFFVPRLKRNEIYQVIQEPAELNGNKISRRLVEVLINEMNDGIDQLPVLQHALNQVWQMAKKGSEEMDLIHFAKIGGLSPNYLPKKDKPVFEEWFNTIPEYKRPFFHHPSLDNVLDSHANELYYKAYDYYKIKNPNSILSIKDAQEIIEVAFKCLTKIDQSRGVRNRMTLLEIVQTIDKSAIGEKEVAGILEVFRLQGNTFLKPFYQDGKENELKSHSVLDITHESLIRNWTNLIEWAKEEDEDYHIWLDFEKQLKRWIENEKSTGYLLPIGPLNFFETWINKKKPNKYWLLKYDESDASFDEKIKNADILLKNAHQFIKRSSRKLFISKTILKYGAQKVAIVISSVIVTLACIYLYFDYANKTNESVLAKSEERGLELLRSDKVKAETKAQFLLLYEERYPGKIAENLAICGNDSTQIRVAFEVFNRLRTNINVFTSRKKTIELADEMKLSICNYLFDQVAKPIFSESDTINYHKAVRLFWILNSFDLAKIHSLDEKLINSIKTYKTKIFDVLYDRYLLNSLASKSVIDGPELFNAVTLLMISNKYNKNKLGELVKLFSPLHNKEAQDVFNISFAKSSQITDNSLALKYNGGYELLASMYAYIGEFEKSIQAIDSVISYDNKFTSRWSYGYQDIAQSYWQGIDKDDTTHDFIYRLAEHRMHLSGGDIERLISQFSYESLQSNLWMNSNNIFKNRGIIYYISSEYFTFLNSADAIFKWYEDRIWKLDLPVNEVHYLQANILKYQAVTSLYIEDTTKGFAYLRRFRKIVEAIDNEYLKDTIVFGESSAQVKTTRRAFLLIPNYVSEQSSWNFTSIWSNSTYHMLHFYNSWNLLDKYDFTDKELAIFATCVLNDINELPLRYGNKYFENRGKEIWEFVSVLKDKIKDKDRKKEVELIWQMMQTIDYKKLYLDENNVFLTDEQEKSYLNKEYYNGSDNVLIAKLNILRIYLLKKIKVGKIDEIFKFISLIENKAEKNNLILDICDLAITLGFDSDAIKLLNYYIKDFNSSKKPPALFYELVGQIGGNDLLSFSKKLLKDSEENVKPTLFKYLIRGMAQKSEYFLAYSLIPESISSSSELEYINEILRAEFLSKNDFETHVEKSWLSGMTNWYENIYESNQWGGSMVIF